MTLTAREAWAVIHGMCLGGIFLLAFAGGIADLWSLRRELLSPEGIRERMFRLMVGTWAMAGTAWVTVLSGTYVVYIWYRAKPPEGADLADFPRAYLLDHPGLKGWHSFGMEWKEHAAWLAPILATAVAWVVTRYRGQLVDEKKLRWMVMALFALAFCAAGVAGLFGAFITKAAPIH